MHKHLATHCTVHIISVVLKEKEASSAATYQTRMERWPIQLQSPNFEWISLEKCVISIRSTPTPSYRFGHILTGSPRQKTHQTFWTDCQRRLSSLYHCTARAPHHSKMSDTCRLKYMSNLEIKSFKPTDLYSKKEKTILINQNISFSFNSIMCYSCARTVSSNSVRSWSLAPPFILSQMHDHIIALQLNC